MDKAKKAKKVKYHIAYRVNGSQKQEFVGYSIEEARDADGKRRVQKRENRIFEMLPEATMTFNELAKWYLGLKSVRALASYERVRGCVENFNSVFGNVVVGNIKPIELEKYQHKREEEGRAPATIDMELSVTQTMVNKAFDNDMVNGRTIKAFRKVKSRLKKGANARDRELTTEEFLKLTRGKYTARWKLRGKPKEEVGDISPAHLKPLLVVAFHTGMRKGELLGLQWSHIHKEKGLIRLPAEGTKERKPKSIPINHHVKKVLVALPRALHHDYVFTYKGQPIKKLRRSFENACDKAGIPYGRKAENGLTFHDIRATFDTNMDRAGVSESCRKAILGHSLGGMDKHYLRLNDQDLKQAMDKYTTWIDAQIPNVDQNVDQKA
jgi:integrase